MSKKLFALLLLLCSITVTAKDVKTGDWNVIPLPQSVEAVAKPAFVINAHTTVYYPTGDAVQKRNAEFLVSYVKAMTGIGITATDRSASNQIRLGVASVAGGDEAYDINVTKKFITLNGATHAAVFRGLQTIAKALPMVSEAKEVALPAAKIHDAPRFAYRGFMLDCGRHFFPVYYIKKFIDVLAMHNINYFHWHLTEDQGWRIEIKKYPLLTEIGSKRKQTVLPGGKEYDGKPVSGYYTQDEARDIVRYAAERHITVIPEVDMPGHIQSALAAYPQLGCTGGPYKVWQMWGVSDNVLCAGNDKVMTFIDNVLKEVTQLFPSKYIHVGGDECPKTQWQKCPKCQARIKALHLEAKDGHSAEERLQSYVITHASNYLKSLGRNTIGWDEILEGGLAEGATVMSWRGEAGGIAAAKQDHDVVMTPNSYLYFDYYQSLDKANEPLAIGGYLPLQRVYSYEPMPQELTADEARHIIGVQANIWTEYMPTFKHMQYMALPRMAALSEVQWTQPQLKDYTDFTNRLIGLTHLYDRLGYNYAKHLYNVNIHIDSDTKWQEIVVHMTTAGDA